MLISRRVVFFCSSPKTPRVPQAEAKCLELKRHKVLGGFPKPGSSTKEFGSPDDIIQNI